MKLYKIEIENSVGKWTQFPNASHEGINWCKGFVFHHLSVYPASPIRIVRLIDNKVIFYSKGNGKLSSF